MANTNRRNFFQSLVQKRSAPALPIEEVAALGDFEQGPVEGANVTDAGDKTYSRRGFRTTSGAALAGFGIGGSLFSCKGKDIEPEPELDPAKTPNISAAKMAVFYGDLNTAVQDKLNRYDETIIEPAKALVETTPGNYSSIKKPNNAFAYASLNGIFQNTSDAELSALAKKVKAIDGYLKKDGKEVEDPNGPGSYILDLRRADVRALMAERFVTLAKQYPKGVFMDAMDSTTLLENNNKVAFAGLTDGALQLMRDVSSRIANEASGKKLIVNGGLYPRHDSSKEDVLVAVATLPNLYKLTVESWLNKGQGDRKSDNELANDTTYIVTRMGKAIKAAQAAGKTSLNIFGIEPAFEGKQVGVVRDAADRYQDLIDQFTPKGFTVNASLYACDPWGHSKTSDLEQNIRFNPLALGR